LRNDGRVCLIRVPAQTLLPVHSKQKVVISVANELPGFYDPDREAIEEVAAIDRSI